MAIVRQNDYVTVQVPAGHTLHLDGDGTVAEIGDNPSISANLSGWPVTIGPLNRAAEFRIQSTLGVEYDVRIDRVIGAGMVRCHSNDLPDHGATGVIYETEGGWVRWDDYNGTYRDLDEASEVPVNDSAPVIAGSGVAGELLHVVNPGTWTNRPTDYLYQWEVDSSAVDGATTPRFLVPVDADGLDVTCEVTAVNIAGNSEPETSNAIEASVPE